MRAVIFAAAAAILSTAFVGVAVAQNSVTHSQSLRTTPPVKGIAPVGARAGNVTFEGQDIESTAFLVMMESAKNAQEDLRGLMASMQDANRRKAAIRNNGVMAPPFVQGQRVTRGLAPVANPCLGRTKPLLVACLDRVQGNVSGLPATPDREALQREIADIKSDLDSMNEMGEMESLRLQMAMDRMSKMMETLSNLLKKMSDTSSAIVQNLK